MDYMEIPLTQGKSAVVDAEDHGWLSKHTWRFDAGYAKRDGGKTHGKRHPNIRMQREILEYHGISLGDMLTDHANLDTLDNRKRNLRPATAGQNNRNRGKIAPNTSGYIGVTLATRNRGWRAYIRYRGRQLHLGYFDDLVEAACAYDRAALEYHREFASLNFDQEHV